VRRSEREVTALKFTLEAKRTADLEVLEREFKSRVAKQVQSVCDQYTTVLYVTAPANNTNLANCTSLRELVISSFNPAVVSALVPQLAGLQTLRLLSFGGTPITLPENLDQLHNLRTLEVRVSYVQGDTMPQVLRRMTGLTSLTYSELGWSTFTVPGWLPELTQLTALDLSNNHFYGAWPTPVFQMHNLRNLFIANSNLWGVIPEEITTLEQLVQLDLSDNYNSHGPAFLGRLTSLQHLRLNNNYVRSIPSTWGHLVHLRSLELSGNQFNCLPQSVRSLPNLDSPWQVSGYAVCPEVPLPLSFNRACYTACQWEPYYEFWDPTE
jgi:Leucine-rich repeat (LRR) protein